MPYAQTELLSHAHFNPRAPRGARRFEPTSAEYEEIISIHVPREGHDGLGEVVAVTPLRISIHVPREGHDAKSSAKTKT